MKKTLDQINPETEPKRILTSGVKKVLGDFIPLGLSVLFLAIFANHGIYKELKEELRLGTYTTQELREDGWFPIPKRVHDRTEYIIGEFFDYVTRPGTELACRHYENNLEPHNID